MMERLKNEPVMGLVVGFIAAAGALLAAFGVPVTPDQVAAVSGFVVAAVLLGLYVRSLVTPTRSGGGGSVPGEREQVGW